MVSDNEEWKHEMDSHLITKALIKYEGVVFPVLEISLWI